MEIISKESKNGDMAKKFFFEVHKDLPREGPGSSKSTQRAYNLVDELPQSARVLDIGCGPGAQTRELAELAGEKVIALDYYASFLYQLKRFSKRSGDESKFHLVNGDMFHLCFASESFDLIWSEGAIYIIGFEEGLREWRRLLKPDGYLAVTECTWLKDNAPSELSDFWGEAYPAMGDLASNLESARQAGYRVLGYIVLPSSDWWEYYHPIEARLRELSDKYQDNPAALQAFEEEEKEIEIFKKYSSYYSYVFYVLQIE